MKAIVLNVIVSSFTSRKDHSMGFRVSTSEMTVPEKTALMELEGINVRLLMEPKDYAVEEKVEVNKEVHAMTCSERLRNVLYVAWKQAEQEIKPDFDTFYRICMDRITEAEKAKLKPHPF